MNEFDCYILYNCLNLHFTSKKFDIFRTSIYSDRLKWTVEGYNKKPEHIRFRFKQISEMREPKLFLTGNVIFNPSKFVRDFESQYHLKFRKQVSNHAYLFSEEIKKIDFTEIRKNPRELISLYLNDEISLITISNVDFLLDILGDGDSITKDTVFFIKKSQGFFNKQLDSCRKILYSMIG